MDPYAKLREAYTTKLNKIAGYTRREMIAEARDRRLIRQPHRAKNIVLRRALVEESTRRAREYLRKIGARVLREQQPSADDVDLTEEDLAELVADRPKKVGDTFTRADVENDKLPTTYPYHAQPHSEHGAWDEVWTIKDATTRDKFREYIADERVVNRYVNMTIPSFVDIVRTFPIGQRGEVATVAKSRAENCLLNIIRLHDIKVGKVYKKYPHLAPVAGSFASIYITHDEIADISRMLQLTIRVFSGVGTTIGKTWHEFPYNRGPVIDVIFENGHATLRKKGFTINNIVYGKLPHCNDIEGLIVDTDHTEFSDPRYFTVLHNDKYTMFKEYRVSSLTGNPADDYGTAHAYIFSDAQYLFKKFKQDYDLQTIRQADMREIVKASEHFIGREMFVPVTPAIRAADHNKSYCSYKTSKYYMGFPGNEFAASLNQQPAGSPYTDVFVVAKSVAGLHPIIARMLRYTGGPIVLPTPMFRYLTDIGCEFDIDYWIASTTKDVDIVGFTQSLANISQDEIKHFRNTLIGRTIIGGMNEAKTTTIRTSSPREFDQVIAECRENGLEFIARPDGSITFKYKTRTNGLFQFHTYILAYSAVQVMDKIMRMRSDGCNIVGYNTDCIYYTHGDATYDVSERPTEIGGWKPESVAHKEWLHKLKVVPLDTPMTYPAAVIPRPQYMEGFRYMRNTLVIGPPGIGKSHEFKTSPLYDQILTTPRRTLREAHKAGEFGFANTFTTHKYIQFSVEPYILEGMRERGRTPRVHKTHVVDECTMFNQHDWDKIIARSGPSTRIIAVGDFEQVRNGIDAPEVTIDYFKKLGFDVVFRERQADGVARHSYDEGCILDQMRLGLEVPKCGRKEELAWLIEHNARQVAILRPHVAAVDNVYEMIPSMIDADHFDIFVSDTHRKLHDVNVFARDYCREHALTFPVITNKGQIIRVDVTSPQIWWGRLTMRDEMPRGEGFKYEPAFAVTADSIQGDTKHMKVYVDANMTRARAFYTAATRTTSLRDIVIVNTNVRPAPAPVQLDNDILDLINELPDKPKRVAVPPMIDMDLGAIPPVVYAKQTDIEMLPTDFIIHTEFPHRHFLKFMSVMHFHSWAYQQPREERQYHEVVAGDLRRFVVDIDGAGFREDDAPKIGPIFVKTFIDAFNAIYKEFEEPLIGPDDLGLVNSSGLSKISNNYKFSLQIRTINRVTTRASCKEFARIYSSMLPPELRSCVDPQVYKRVQNFRCVGSTKAGDDRWSRLMYSDEVAPDDVWIGQFDQARVINVWPIAQPEEAPANVVQEGLAGRICAAAAPFTHGLKYQMRNQVHVFKRMMTSMCSVCKREHDHDNMFVTEDAGVINLRCRRSPHECVELFRVDPPALDTPAVEPVPVDNAPTTDGPLVDCPKPETGRHARTHNHVWGPKDQIKLLKRKLATILSWSREIVPDSFASYDAWSKCCDIMRRLEGAMSQVKNGIRTHNMSAKAVKKYVTAKMKHRAQKLDTLNREMNSRSDPVNIDIHRQLKKLCGTHLRKNDTRMALFYQTEGVFELALSIQNEIDVLSGDITSAEAAARIHAALFPRAEMTPAEVAVDAEQRDAKHPVVLPDWALMLNI